MDVYKKRRTVFAWLLAIALVAIGAIPVLRISESITNPTETETAVLSETAQESGLAKDVLEKLEVKGRAPKTGYARDEFGSGWASIDGCDTRNIVLAETLRDVELGEDGCVVLSGILQDPYTGKEISFQRGSTTSGQVQIDHVVALSEAWQKGAQQLAFDERVVFANDSLNLLAVDGPANQQKGDSDAASWLPTNRTFRCQYVARQIAVKQKYRLWVSEAEKAVMSRTLNGCAEQRLPVEN